MISGGSELLSVPDLPKHIDVDGQTFELNYGDFVAGDLHVLQGDFIDAGINTTLREGLQEKCPKYETCFLTVKGNTCALISQRGRYAVVDSHARNSHGMVDAKGKSIVLYFSSLEQVFYYIITFAGQPSDGPALFELSGICVNKMDNEECFIELGDVSTGSQRGCSSVEFVCVEEEQCTSLEKPRKCKMATQCSSFKKMKMTDVDQVNSDVVFVSSVRSRSLMFNPLSQVVAETVCKQLNVDCEKSESVSCLLGELGVPCMMDKIVPDGNCFFRAVSQAVSGTQKWHRKIRLAVVKQLERNPNSYKNILRAEFSSVADYINRSRMRYVGSWATEVEIQAEIRSFQRDKLM
ncbi:uncharacterized protein LOC124884451 isoform X1 [Girardinichthys multiradiatus]|uniref:uncharacterized protein LOC124884451 isoform X1 n=1 Tax=Girardinichthys multiradiatus TaxID=208333 RepID=UPI001FADB8E2|nr:uncharacterized protein LOC124884451 isoform X1 [Girardinichthys multiradiatus]